MKTFKTLFLLIFCIALMNCSNNDDINLDNASIDKDSFTQTIWEGTYVLTDNNNELIEGRNLLIQFVTSKNGQYYYRYSDGSSSYVYPFGYSIEGKMISIDSNVLDGIGGLYTLIEINKKKKKIVFVEYSRYTATLTLYKKH